MTLGEIYLHYPKIAGHTGETSIHGRDRPLAERPLPAGWCDVRLAAVLGGDEFAVGAGVIGPVAGGVDASAHDGVLVPTMATKVRA